jgi:hypothetical protein
MADVALGSALYQHDHDAAAMATGGTVPDSLTLSSAYGSGSNLATGAAAAAAAAAGGASSTGSWGGAARGPAAVVGGAGGAGELAVAGAAAGGPPHVPDAPNPANPRRSLEPPASQQAPGRRSAEQVQQSARSSLEQPGTRASLEQPGSRTSLEQQPEARTSLDQPARTSLEHLRMQQAAGALPAPGPAQAQAASMQAMQQAMANAMHAAGVNVPVLPTLDLPGWPAMAFASLAAAAGATAFQGMCLARYPAPSPRLQAVKEEPSSGDVSTNLSSSLVPEPAEA